MTPMLVVVAAAIGAVARLLIGVMVCSWQALLVVNSVGAGLLGWAVHANVSSATLTVIGVGFCGALTSYSSFAAEAHALGWRWGTGYATLTVFCACGSASIGATLV